MVVICQVARSSADHYTRFAEHQNIWHSRIVSRILARRSQFWVITAASHHDPTTCSPQGGRLCPRSPQRTNCAASLWTSPSITFWSDRDSTITPRTHSPSRATRRVPVRTFRLSVCVSLRPGSIRRDFAGYPRHCTLTTSVLRRLGTPRSARSFRSQLRRDNPEDRAISSAPLNCQGPNTVSEFPGVSTYRSQTSVHKLCVTVA